MTGFWQRAKGDLRRVLGRVEPAAAAAAADAYSRPITDAREGPLCSSVPSTAVIERLRSVALNPLFEATVQGVEESVVNALVAARTMTGADYWTVSALPPDQLQNVLRGHGMLVGKGAQ